MGNAFNSGLNFQENFTLSLGPQIESVVPQPVDITGNTLTQRRNQIDVYFNNDPLNVASADNPAFYQLIYTNNTLTNTDDTVFLPTSVNYVASLNKATLTFASNLDQLSTGPGTYRLQIGTSQSAPAAPLIINPIATASSDFNTGGLATLQFNAVAPAKAGNGISLNVTKSNLGPGVGPTIKVFGQSIDVILNNTGGSDTSAQQLVNALNSNPNSSALIVASVTGNPATDITAPNITYSPVNLTYTKGMGTSFSTAYDTTPDLKTALNPTGSLNQSVVYTGAIVPVNTTVTYPGGLNEPGSRVLNIPDANNQFAYSPGQNAVPASGDTTAGITTVFYNFRSDYGFDPSSGNSFLNVITANEEQRTREAFEEISRVAGVNFVETANQGVTIATGDLRAIVNVPPGPVSASGPIHVQGLASSIPIPIPSRPDIVLNAAETWDDSYGGTWFQAVYHEILHYLGARG